MGEPSRDQPGTPVQVFRDLLVPLDGSHFSETALPLASAIARGAKARLHLLLVHEPAPLLVGPAAVPLPAPELEAALRQRDRDWLAQAAERWRQPAGAAPGTRTVDGRAGPEICEEARRLPADLLIMATHGRGTFRRLWFGSVADYVVRHLEVPVVLVPPGPAETAEPREPKLRRILVALDLSRESEAILRPAAALARLGDAELTLFHIAIDAFALGSHGAWEAGRHPLGRDERELASREEALERVAGTLRQEGLSVATRVEPGINAAGSLLDAMEEDYDLLALTTHGAGGVHRFLVGSVADKVMRGAAKPVLICRPPEA